MNVVPFLIPGLAEPAPTLPAEISWPLTGQSDLFAQLLQASLGKPAEMPDPWPASTETEVWPQAQPTDADPAFLPDTDVPAPVPFALSSEAGSAIASFSATKVEPWLVARDVAVSQRPTLEQPAAPADPKLARPVVAIDLQSGELIRRIPIRITTDAAAEIAHRNTPVDLQFDVALPRSQPFTIPAELDIPDRPVPAFDPLSVNDPVRVPTPALMPETGKRARLPEPPQAKPDVNPRRTTVAEVRPATTSEYPQEQNTERSDPASLRAIARTPEVESYATPAADAELKIARAQKRGRVRPLHLAPTGHVAPGDVAAAAVQAPKAAVSQHHVSTSPAVRQGHLEAQSSAEIFASADLEAGSTATPSADSGPGSLVESLAGGRAQNLDPEAPIPVRFVLEDWTAGQPVKRVRMLLEPKELGGLRIFLRQNHRGIHARIVADRSEALPHVEAGMSALRSVLSARGIQFSSFSLTAVTAATAAGAAGLRPDGMPNGESAGAKQETRSQGKSKKSGRTTRS
jgi:hypothetical protein